MQVSFCGIFSHYFFPIIYKLNVIASYTYLYVTYIYMLHVFISLIYLFKHIEFDFKRHYIFF